ncbi:MAG: AraC family transcriptional regulator [Proteobacteria bacterium]|nr:AraC family transcriptional regulator [Pseudomonadota bacterium]
MRPIELQAELFARLAMPFTAEAVFDSLDDVVFFIKNRRGEYVVVNQTLVERCRKRSKAELVGVTVDTLFPASLGRSYRSQDEHVLTTGEAIRDQLELHVYPGGRRGWCLTTKLPMLGGGGKIVGLVGLSRDLQTPNRRNDDFSRIAEALRRIRTRFDERLKVRELARDAGLSQYQFERRIRRVFGITAGQLIRKIRMDEALRRLRAGERSIAAIASACGYADQSAFTRKFRRTVGCSPSEYRALADAPRRTGRRAFSLRPVKPSPGAANA